DGGGGTGRPKRARRQQRRFFPQKAGLARTTPIGRDRGGRYQGGSAEGQSRRRHRARRADGNPRGRTLRLVHGYRGQSREHASAHAWTSALMKAVVIGEASGRGIETL